MTKTKCYRYTYTVGTLSGDVSIRTGKEEKELPELVYRLVIKYLDNAGITVTSDDIDNLVQVPTKTENVPQTAGQAAFTVLYRLASYSYKNQPGPYHLLVGNGDTAECACGANRNPKNIVDRSELRAGEKWPDHPYCAACHKIWTAKERARKAGRKSQSAA